MLCRQLFLAVIMGFNFLVGFFHSVGHCLSVLVLCGLFGLARADQPASLSILAAPCLACHSIEADEATRVGPSLAGIAGRALGADRNYIYSEAFTQKATEGVVWDRDTLDQFLKQPQSLVEGTAMSYRGLENDAHRTLLIDWLFSDSTGNVAELLEANYKRDPFVREIMDIQADQEYGEYLAGECLTCHQLGDSSGRVPTIHNLTTDYFIHALLEYQSGTRANRVMQSISSALGMEEIAALSAVFTRNPK